MRARLQLQSDFLDCVIDPKRGAAKDLHAIATNAGLVVSTDDAGEVTLSGVVKDTARVSAWKALLEYAHITPVVGDAGEDDQVDGAALLEQELSDLCRHLEPEEAQLLISLVARAARRREQAEADAGDR